ncbi:MAG TPA: hypothetical protein VHZ81_10600 [Galbitalea sp.]|jgi:2-polyprenyl-6-methoxyphenol hydroxylase-like FAD-dependent oxidoreductase|nr:hypothetical protein [Galbitalea sp.]
MAPAKKLHVLIAGGGLSGLCLAQGLLGDGNTCEVFERDAVPRRSGYYLNINGDGGEALRRCLPDDLFELYRQTSRTTPDRSGSIVLDDQLNELSSQPHLGPPNDGPDRHTGVNRQTLRQILLARLGRSFRTGLAVLSYTEDADGVTVQLSTAASPVATSWSERTASARRYAANGFRKSKLSKPGSTVLAYMAALH